MESLLNEIERALELELYYLAIVLALTLPDICAALEDPNGVTRGEYYKAWYNKYFAIKYPSITDNDCWSLRCGVVHQGRCGHPNMQYDRVVFTMPGAPAVLHNNFINGALNLDIELFCQDMIDTVRDWYNAQQNNPNVKSNLPHLVRYRPKGLAPYVVGMPVIA